ncbi:hypothetical protein BCh11DRAFT_03373 [Burkholderia sp. Ch1-1]|uniref:hypothetical protein n=1 Tax=Paraburkholderia sp. USG1 TaxID=2952268 RepID=UPI0001D25C95|nr:hypothetical protein [Paraburkholderia sp. USG1]EIF35549.1 hypothetical protein BCh11DRAFT_03373 [Burkholderia sp. Ch1-1]MDR8397411.1 hypothetical protein [Paraburkholderia sp. USG1]
MNRPLALIEGDLALPSARPFDALPPPFGSRRGPAQAAAPREPRPKSRTDAQRAIQNAVQPQASAIRRGTFPPGVKFLLFYKLPQQRDHSRRFDEQLAEARHYLEIGGVRPRSTRSDHVLGAAIFAGCGIALAWLLTTCATHGADKAATAVIGRVAVRPPVEFTGTVTQSGSSAANSTPKPAASKASAPANATPGAAFGNVPTSESQRVEHLVKQWATRVSADQAAPSRPAKANRQVSIARLSKLHVDGRLALSRITNAATQPSPSKSGEWTARSSSVNETAERATLFDWAAQQRRAAITTHAGVPTPGDTDWNARMTQRRVTDNPDAFNTSRSMQ